MFGIFLMYIHAPVICRGLYYFIHVQCHVCTAPLIEEYPDLLQEMTLVDPSEQLCHKDTGKGKRLRKWSRGH